MRKPIGVILSIALGILALDAVPVSANHDGATDTWHADVPTGVPC